MFRKLIAIVFLFAAMQSQAQQSEWIYHAKQGDTLWDLCLKYTNKRGCWITLSKYNNVANDRAIPVNTAIRIPTAWLKKPLVVGNVVYISGSAEYSRWDDKEYAQLLAGQDVHLGSKIRTGGKSVVKLLLQQTNEVLIKESSELVLERFSSNDSNVLDEKIMLNKGSADVEVNSGKVKNRFIIKTPAAIAAVRGTEFRINSTGDKMRGEVLEGQIDVSSDNSSQSVPAGFGVSATKGKAIEPPRALPPQPKMAKISVKSPLPARIDWGVVNQADQYQVTLYDSNEQILSIDTVANNWIVYESLDKTCYLVKVHSIDGDGFHGLDSQTSLCVIDDLASVDLTDQISLQDDGDNLLMSWEKVAGADGYKVQASTDEGFTNIIEEVTTSDTQATLPKVKGQKVYYRVISMDNSGRVGQPSNVLHYKDKSLLHSILTTVFLTGIAFL